MRQRFPVNPVFFPTSFAIVLSAGLVLAQEGAVPFDSDRWELGSSKVVEHLGQKSLRGPAMLKDANFTDGVVEVDIAMDESRAFPGILFHVQSPRECENIYVRPHRSGEPVAVQYTPMFNGMDAWQLYHGAGYGAQADIPLNRWVPVRLEVKGTQARLFIDNAPAPAIVVDELKHGAIGGSLGLFESAGANVHFANFRYRSDSTLRFPPPARVAVADGLITSWKLSQAFPISSVDRARSPEAQGLAGIEWRDVSSEASGLVNVSRWVARTGLLPDVVLAKAEIRAEKAHLAKLSFGYSDEVTVFLNGKPVFTGDASYRVRDPLFYGAVGLYDAVFLDLKEGVNELLFMDAEVFGGWGFMARLEPLPTGGRVLGNGVTALWETPAELAYPESAVYDPLHDAVYVSSFVGPYRPGQEPQGFVSKVKGSGEIEALRWVIGLKSPAGLAVWKDRLFVVERDGVAEVDTTSGKIVHRLPATGAKMLNDIAVSPEGVVFVSDSGAGVIYRSSDGTLQPWLSGPEVSQPNGVLVDGGRLVWGNNGDRCLKAVDLASKEITPLVRMPPGLIDGVESDGAGNLVVSHWEGNVYRVRPTGELETLLDTSDTLTNAADIDVVPEKGLLLVPTFLANRLTAYRVAR